MYVNFVRIHQTLKIMPAMAANVTHKLWGMDDVVALVDAYDVELKQRRKADADERREQSYTQFGDALGSQGLKFPKR